MRFREAREAAGLSQKYVAITLGVKPPNVSRWEAGTTWPTIENLMALSKLYGVSVDYLLGCGEAAGISQLTAEESDLLLAYRQATADTRRAVRAVLGVADQTQDGRAISG